MASKRVHLAAAVQPGFQPAAASRFGGTRAPAELPGAVRTGSTSPPKVEAVSKDAVAPEGRHWFLPEDPNPGARQTDKTRACGFPGSVLSWMQQEQPLWPLCLCHLEMSSTWVSGRMGSFAV